MKKKVKKKVKVAMKISTMVCCGLIPTTFDLNAIFNYLSIDSTVLGMKYLNQIKGDGVKPTKSFYNQITIVMQIPGKIVNIKAFSNGKFQISGIKELDQAVYAIKTLLHSLKSINIEKEIPSITVDGVVMSPDKSIIYNHLMQEVGKIDQTKNSSNSYRIHDELVERKNNSFITVEYKDRHKKVFDLKGNLIGTMYIDLVPEKKNKKNISYKNLTYSDDGFVYNKWKQCLGVEKIRPIGSIQNSTPKDLPQKTTCNYSAIADTTVINQLKVYTTNINWTTQLKLPETTYIDRNRLFFSFIENGYRQCQYNPCIYPGVKLIYPLSLCDEHKTTLQRRKCSECTKVSIILFKSGKVLVSGCKNKHDMDRINLFLNEYMEKNSSTYIVQESEKKEKKVIPMDSDSPTPTSSTLSIFDLI